MSKSFLELLFFLSMKVEEVCSSEKNEPTEFSAIVSWEGRTVSAFEKKRGKELLRLKNERPAKTDNRQNYYLYRAREEQILYELDFRNCGVELLRGNYFESLTLYGHALNHLKRRTEYESKLFAVWLQRVKAQENPPTPDILFINHGIFQHQLV